MVKSLEDTGEKIGGRSAQGKSGKKPWNIRMFSPGEIELFSSLYQLIREYSIPTPDLPESMFKARVLSKFNGHKLFDYSKLHIPVHLA